MDNLKIWLKFKNGGKHVVIKNIELKPNFRKVDLVKYVWDNIGYEDEDEITDSIKGLVLKSEMVVTYEDVFLESFYTTTVLYDWYKVTMAYDVIEGKILFKKMFAHNSSLLFKAEGDEIWEALAIGTRSFKYGMGSLDRMYLKIESDKMVVGESRSMKIVLKGESIVI